MCCCVLSCSPLSVVTVALDTPDRKEDFSSEDQNNMNILAMCCTLLILVLVSKTSAATLPQLEGIDHWFDDQEGLNGRLVDQEENRTLCNCSGKSGNPEIADWMETVRNDIRRLSDRLDMREMRKGTLSGKSRVVKCHESCKHIRIKSDKKCLHFL